jgi:polyphosphate glucokinase
LQSGPQALQFLLMTTQIRKAPSSAPRAVKKTSNPITISIDIGGSGLKAMLLDAAGKPVSERVRLATPAVPTPRSVLRGLEELRKTIPAFDRVSVGFPGVIKRGTTWTAANLHPAWIGYPLQAELEKIWKKPVRVANDAAVQGYGAIKGDGVELALTLGTGLGSSLFTNGRLCPGLELAHHPWKRDREYEDYLGRRGLDKFGKKRWNKLLQEAIEQTAKLFNWDHLYLGGGNTKKIDFKPGKNIEIVSNEAGLLGGVALWREWQ